MGLHCDQPVKCPGVRNEFNSHKAIWEPFSARLLAYLSTQAPTLCWFLWGSEAASSKPYFKAERLFECRHPMMCPEKYPDDFFNCSCFLETMDEINWMG